MKKTILLGLVGLSAMTLAVAQMVNLTKKQHGTILKKMVSLRLLPLQRFIQQVIMMTIKN